MQQIVEYLSRRTAGTDVLVQHYTHKQLANIWNHHVTPSGDFYFYLCLLKKIKLLIVSRNYKILS